MNSAHSLKYSLKSLYSGCSYFLLHAIDLKALVASYLLIYAHKIIMCTSLPPGLDLLSLAAAMRRCYTVVINTWTQSAAAQVGCGV